MASKVLIRNQLKCNKSKLADQIPRQSIESHLGHRETPSDRGGLDVSLNGAYPTPPF